jgi:hypothetical protein
MLVAEAVYAPVSKTDLKVSVTASIGLRARHGVRQRLTSGALATLLARVRRETMRAPHGERAGLRGRWRVSVGQPLD